MGWRWKRRSSHQWKGRDVETFGEQDDSFVSEVHLLIGNMRSVWSLSRPWRFGIVVIDAGKMNDGKK